MSLIAFLIISACFLAYSNGANDNIKGVATLLGSKTANYKVAIGWATITTFAGSIASIFLAQILIKNFSGKGLVPDAIAASPDFLTAVAMGSALTVMLATLTGFPISTTHALTGALTGVGFMAVGSQVNFLMLGQKFLLPLFISPFIAVGLSAFLYMIFRYVRIKSGIQKEYCVCIGRTQRVLAVSETKNNFTFRSSQMPELTIEEEKNCRQRYVGDVIGINCQKALDIAHYMSAGMVSFARGLNDTPKIVALLLTVKAFHLHWGMLVIGICIAVGGLFNARKVAHTMSEKITQLNHGQGFTANLVTGFLVIVASRLGFPVSTTHASCGSLFGIGLVTGQGNSRVISGIALSWLLTLPIAALLSGGVYWILIAS